MNTKCAVSLCCFCGHWQTYIIPALVGQFNGYHTNETNYLNMNAFSGVIFCAERIGHRRVCVLLFVFVLFYDFVCTRCQSSQDLRCRGWFLLENCMSSVRLGDHFSKRFLERSVTRGKPTSERANLRNNGSWVKSILFHSKRKNNRLEIPAKIEIRNYYLTWCNFLCYNYFVSLSCL